jgi:hypothetical protein
MNLRNKIPVWVTLHLAFDLRRKWTHLIKVHTKIKKSRDAIIVNIKYCVIITMLCLSSPAYAQKIDSEMVFLNAKISILSSQNSCITKDDVEEIVAGNLIYKTLNSRGFEDIFFFEVIITPLDPKDTLSYYINGSLYSRYKFIFGYNISTNQLYKLNGFFYDDFRVLYQFLFRDYDGNVLTNRKRFLEYFSIDQIDIKCLYDSMKKKQKKRNIRKMCKCLVL